MPVPKRKHSKRRSKIKRYNHYIRKLKAKVKQVVQVKDNVYKRPHIDEEIQL